MADSKEAIYDEHISPLMAQIIALCKQHKIAVYASFDLAEDTDDDLACTTYIVDETTHPDWRALHGPLHQRVNPQPFNITVRDASGAIKEMHTYVG